MITFYLNEGYYKGDSNYIIATEDPIDENNRGKSLQVAKWAIYDGRTKEKLTDFFDWIAPQGLVKGQSPYFRATRDKKEAIFTLEGQITPWYKKIRERGAVSGESRYYWAKEKAHYALYNIDTGEKLTPDFKSSVLAGAVVGTSAELVVGSFGEEIFFIYNIRTKQIVSKEFDEDKLIEILKHGNLEKALLELAL